MRTVREKGVCFSRDDRETESSQFVRAGVCGAPRLSVAPSLRLSLLLLRSHSRGCVLSVARQSGAVQSRTKRSQRAGRRLQRRLFPLLSLTLSLQVKKGAQGHIPGVARESVHAQARPLLRTHTHTNTQARYLVIKGAATG